jgi:predicted MFS family arabinose efflux permease
MTEAAAAQTLDARAEWRRRWPLVMAAVIGFSFHSVMTSFSSIFIGPIGEEFGWSRTQVTSGMTLSSVIGTIISPFYGVLLDRWGTRVFAIPGLVMKSAVMASFALMSNSIVHWLAMWLLYCFASTMVKSTVWTTAVTGVFTAGRGLALGVVMSGTAIAQAVVPPLGHYLIEGFGWRMAFVILGAGWGGVALALCIPFLRDAHDDLKASRQSPAETADAKRALPGLSIPEAWRSKALWRIAISTFVVMLFTLALVVHQVAILEEAGVARSTAAWLAGLAGIAGIAGKLITGKMLDWWRPNIVGGATIAGASLGFALLLDPLQTPALIVVAMLINGYASGTKLQICAYLTSRYAGIRNFATIFSIMASLVALGAGLGPMIGGIAYDLQGNYSSLLIAGIIGSIFSGWLIFGLEAYPHWSSEPNKGAAAAAEPV